jgi:hypothetical protein
MHQSKMLSTKKIDMFKDFAAGVNKILKRGETVSLVGILDPAL